MGDWFLGEIRLFSMPWNPQDWLLCDGSLLQVSQNQALYSLLGTAFGGNGQTTFALPDLRGRTLTGVSTSDASYQRGKAGGTETVALTATQVAMHQHLFKTTSSNGTSINISAGAYVSTPAPSAPVPVPPSFFTASSSTQTITLNPGSITNTGGSINHPNLQPSLVLNFCIARSGIYPPRN